MKNAVEIPVFIAHPFKEDIIGINIDKYRNSINRLFTSTQILLNRQSGAKIHFDLFFDDHMFGAPLPASIREKLRQSYVVFADITGLRPNVLYEVGYAHSLNKEILIVKSANEEGIPTDIVDLLIESYVTIDDLKGKLFSRLRVYTENLTQRIKLGILQEVNISELWFDQDISEISIICSPEPEKSSFADLRNSDYLYIDNLEDRDCLLEVSNFLSRSFPRARVIKYSSSNVPHEVLSGNLVLIGGPGFDECEGNGIAREIIKLSNLGIKYLQDETVNFINKNNGDIVHKAVEYKNEVLTKDVGYFASIPNPLNNICKVIICQGIHTFGTLGGFFAFSDNTVANRNINKLFEYSSRSTIRGAIYFETIFDVQILSNRRVVTPEVDLMNVVFI